VRVLLDEDLAHALRHALIGHQVFTVSYLGWNGIENGALITRAEAEGFEVFVTGDRNLSYQQNFEGRRIAMVVLTAHNWPIIRNHLAAISAAVDRATEGSYELVNCGEFRRG
jgi:hypothetical protein